jgi:hypothetical protein
LRIAGCGPLDRTDPLDLIDLIDLIDPLDPINPIACQTLNKLSSNSASRL